MSNALDNFFPYELNIFGSLKGYASSWEDLIFSYSFKHGDFADKFNLTFLQNKIGSSDFNKGNVVEFSAGKKQLSKKFFN